MLPIPSSASPTGSAKPSDLVGRAGDVLEAFRKSRESVRPDDVILLREARRDLEHARILLEGLCRTHRIDFTATAETSGK